MVDRLSRRLNITEYVTVRIPTRPMYIISITIILPATLSNGVIPSVSPTVLAESLESYGPFFYGFEPAASRVAMAYSRSVEGAQTGQVYRVW